MSWRRLEDVFSVTIFHLPRRLQDVFKSCLQDLFQRRLQDVFKTSSKTSSRRICKTSSLRHLAIMSSRRPQDVLKDNKMLCWGRVQNVFSTSSSRRMFAGLRHLRFSMVGGKKANREIKFPVFQIIHSVVKKSQAKSCLPNGFTANVSYVYWRNTLAYSIFYWVDIYRLL